MGQEALDRSETIPDRNDRQCMAPRSVEYEFEDEHEIAHRTVFRNCERVCSSSSKERILAKKQEFYSNAEGSRRRDPSVTCIRNSVAGAGVQPGSAELTRLTTLLHRVREGFVAPQG
jgi:hypothetical protein